MFRAVRLLFAAQVFVTCLADSQKVSIKVAFFLFRRSNLRLAILQFWNWFACYSLHGSSLFRSGDGHDHAEVSFVASNREMETTRSSTNLGRRVPGWLAWQAQWFQDLIHELIMCVVRGWVCEVRCGHDDWHVEVALFPLCSCV